AAEIAQIALPATVGIIARLPWFAGSACSLREFLRTKRRKNSGRRIRILTVPLTGYAVSIIFRFIGIIGSLRLTQGVRRSGDFPQFSQSWQVICQSRGAVPDGVLAHHIAPKLPSDAGRMQESQDTRACCIASREFLTFLTFLAAL